ncbi:peptide chain release factor N(5)-glutamine methyltransferase [Chelonobacter oris]|uniref:peptide chain release factor N(5)-glutamine methyltransferase n=1 Tax=Chelonobacter oris TaxID=505317 RepID=UPI0009FE7FD8|nr:peptide chain release factor N(5)-glutamine methyltransferase [Chelonobacter oris]
MTYQQWLNQAADRLNRHESAKREAQLLLQHITGSSRASIMAFSERELHNDQLQQLTALLQRRVNGEPMAYILGEKEFWSLTLKVSPYTLIPRPDTEILVEKALLIAIDYIRQCAVKEYRILDLGTGTGAIALALAKELSAAIKDSVINVTGVDKIPQSVELAKENQRQNGVKNVTFLVSDWFKALEGQHFDMIVGNPPYIDSHDVHLSEGDVRFEPHSALVANDSGYADLRHIIEQAPVYLKPHGSLLLEHGWQQGCKVRSLFQKYIWQDIETIRDYGDNERVTLARYTGKCEKDHGNIEYNKINDITTTRSKSTDGSAG